MSRRTLYTPVLQDENLQVIMYIQLRDQPVENSALDRIEAVLPEL